MRKRVLNSISKTTIQIDSTGMQKRTQGASSGGKLLGTTIDNLKYWSNEITQNWTPKIRPQTICNGQKQKIIWKASVASYWGYIVLFLIKDIIFIFGVMF